MKFFLLFFVAMISGIAVMLGIQAYTVKIKPRLDVRYVSTSSFSVDKAPKNSLSGEIILLSGDVAWESRASTEAAKISTPQEIKQGESLFTTSGNATIQFENNAKILINPNSEIDIVQTLPSNFVFGQNKGTIEYNRSGETQLSVRVLHLLINQDIGSMLVSISPEGDIVTIEVKDGKITVAFNDLDYNSNVLEINEGKTLIFNDTIREAEVN